MTPKTAQETEGISRIPLERRVGDLAERFKFNTSDPRDNGFKGDFDSKVKPEIEALLKDVTALRDVTLEVYLKYKAQFGAKEKLPKGTLFPLYIELVEDIKDELIAHSIFLERLLSDPITCFLNHDVVLGKTRFITVENTPQLRKYVVDVTRGVRGFQIWRFRFGPKTLFTHSPDGVDKAVLQYRNNMRRAKK